MTQKITTASKAIPAAFSALWQDVEPLFLVHLHLSLHIFPPTTPPSARLTCSLRLVAVAVRRLLQVTGKPSMVIHGQRYV